MHVITTFRTLAALFVLLFFATQMRAQASTSYEYVIIEVGGVSIFSSKVLRATADFGDTEEQKEKSTKYSAILSDLKTRTAVLNYMIEDGYELIEILLEPRLNDGSSNRSDFFFIMKKLL